MNRRHHLGSLVAVALATVLVSPAGASAHRQPVLVGRAVLPVATYQAGSPDAGTFFDGQKINGISFKLDDQPVEGFSAIIAGRRSGEYLAMPDNGFGTKANSYDFLIRAYYIEPRFKTAQGGSGTVVVKDFISFRDPLGRIGFPIVKEGTTNRLLTGADIDPESIQRAPNGDYWVGEEFGPWILHFDRTGVLLDPPFAAPGDLMSPNNPHLVGAATQPNSRGFEATAISPDGRYLYAVLEGPTVAAGPNALDRLVFQFDIRHERFTGRSWIYPVTKATRMVSDIDALDDHRFVLIERDGGSGATALDRKVYAIDLRSAGRDKIVESRPLVDLAAIPDPYLVSMPAIHAGDLGLGDPFQVTSESVEAVHVLPGGKLLIGCDNNFPNTGRNPGLADDNEFIVVSVPGLDGW